MAISDIVNVQITRETDAVTRVGFGTLMILGEHTVFNNRIRYYENAQAILAEGFTTADPEYVAALAAFSQAVRPVRVAIGRIDDTDFDTAASLTAVSAESDDWYALVLTSRNVTSIMSAAAWIETRNKIFGTAANTTTILDPTSTTDLASLLMAQAYTRTFIMFHATAGAAFPEAAWMGLQLVTAPGSSTWAFKNLTGVVPSELSTAERMTAFSKNCNTFELRAGARVTREGKVSSGEFIDIIRGIDWLQTRIAERIFARLEREPKIPYTDAGVAIIETELSAQLDVAVTQGVLASIPLPQVQVPLVANIDPVARGNRLLPDITFTATLAGAIHSINISGTVTI